MDHSTPKQHTQLRDFFSCLCPPKPAASSDRKPQFPLLLLLWASHSLFLFIPLFFAFVFHLLSQLLSKCFSGTFLICLSPTPAALPGYNGLLIAKLFPVFMPSLNIIIKLKKSLSNLVCFSHCQSKPLPFLLPLLKKGIYDHTQDYVIAACVVALGKGY